MPRDVLVGRCVGNPVCSKSVPIRSIEDVCAVNLQLKQEITQLKQVPSESRELSRELVRVATVLEKEMRARNDADAAAAAEAQARELAQLQVHEVTRQMRREKREAEVERQRAEGKVARLE